MPCYLTSVLYTAKAWHADIAGHEELGFAGLRKRIAFRHSWQRQQGSRQDSVPGMTKSSLELALGTLEVLPCTAGRSPGVQGDWKPTRQCSPRARERVYLGSQVKLHSVPQLVRNGKRWHRLSVQTGCSFGAVVVCGAGSHTVTYLCEQDPCMSTSS